MDIEEYASKYIQYYHPEKIPIQIKKLLTKDVETVLDCGCGDGNLLYALKRQGFLESKKVIGVDLSRNRLKIAKLIDPKYSFKVDNAENLRTIKSNSIDLFISTYLIEHVNDAKMLKAINRVVKRSKYAYISTLYKKWYGWFYYKNSKGEWALDPTHVREYTNDKQLLDLVKKAGFKVENSYKRLFVWPIVHPFLRLLKIQNRQIFENKLIYLLGRIKIPIPGYYSWELVIRKN